ncbi:hypothetical protein D3C75_1298830 [compost metagenome]
MTIKRQELLMGSGVFFNARVLVIDILVEAFSPQGQRLLNVAHAGQMVNGVPPVSRLVAC